MAEVKIIKHTSFVEDDVFHVTEITAIVKHDLYYLLSQLLRETYIDTDTYVNDLVYKEVSIPRDAHWSHAEIVEVNIEKDTMKACFTVSIAYSRMLSDVIIEQDY